MDFSTIPYEDILKLGGAGAVLTGSLYIGLKLFSRFGNIESDYADLLKSTRNDRDEWRDRALKCEAENNLLKNQRRSARRKK